MFPSLDRPAPVQLESLDDAVQVFCMDTRHIPPVQLDGIAKYVSSDEFQQVSMLRFQKDRRDRLVARAMLRMVLSILTSEHYTAWSFRKNANGRPEIDQPHCWSGLQFNLTHTDGFVACAITGSGLLGVDAERIVPNKYKPADMKACLSDPEYYRVCSSPEHLQDPHFFQCWTLKEAYAKAVGKGLHLPFRQFSILPDTSGSFRLSCPPSWEHCPDAWQFSSVQRLEGIQLSVASRRNEHTRIKVIIHDDFDIFK